MCPMNAITEERVRSVFVLVCVQMRGVVETVGRAREERAPSNFTHCRLYDIVYLGEH